MAPLTWRNVDAPNGTGAAEILAMAGEGFARGTEGLGKALGGIGTARNTRASAAALPILAQVANESGVDQAISRVAGMVNPNQWSPELQQAVAGLRDSALGFESKRASTGAVIGANNRAQQNHDRGILREDQLASLTPQLAAAREQAYLDNAGTGIPATAGSSTLSRLLAEREGAGNYDTLFGHSQNNGPFAGTRVSQMTVGEAIKFSDPSAPYAQWVKDQVGRVATPMGAGQIVGTTLRNTAAEMGIDPNTPFDANTQTAMIDHLARKRLASASTLEGKRAALRQEWEGFKSVPDSQLDQAIAEMESGSISGMYDPALGANYSTVQQQGEQAPMPRVAQILNSVEGSLIRPDDILGIIDDNWNAGTTARQDMDADRARDQNYERAVIAAQRQDRDDARSEEKIATEEFAVQKADEIWRTMASPEEMAQTVYNDQSLSPEQKTATLARLGVLSENAGNYFEAPELTGEAAGVSTQLAEAADAIATRNRIETEFNPLIQVMNEVEATAAASGGDDAAAVTQALADLESSGAKIGNDIDRAGVIDTANKLAKEYGVNPQTVLRLAQGRIKGGFWRNWWGNDVVVDERALRATLESYGDKQQFAAAAELQRQLKTDQESFGKYQADYLKYAGQSENLARRGTPAARKRAEELAQKAVEAQEKANAIAAKIEQGYTARRSTEEPVLEDAVTSLLGQTPRADQERAAAQDRALQAASQMSARERDEIAAAQALVEMKAKAVDERFRRENRNSPSELKELELAQRRLDQLLSRATVQP